MPKINQVKIMKTQNTKVIHMNTKKEIIDILKTSFGSHITEFIEQYYDEDSPEELIELARELLIAKVGKEKTNELMKDILENNNQE